MSLPGVVNSFTLSCHNFSVVVSFSLHVGQVSTTVQRVCVGPGRWGWGRVEWVQACEFACGS